MLTISPRVLIEAVVRIWQALEGAFSTLDGWQQFSGQLLHNLRLLDDPAADQLATALRIVSLFESHPSAHGMLATALAEGQGRTSSSGGPHGLESPLKRQHGGDLATLQIRVERWSGDAIVDIPTRYARVNVLFGTDRLPVAPVRERLQFSAERADELSFGIASVSIPDDHRKGRLERPRWYFLEFRETPDKHVVIMDVRPLTRAKFIAHAKARGREGSRDEGLIFVHGYNVNFEEAIRRTAQLAYDLEFRGSAIAYSWPSEGGLLGYGADANVTESSVWPFREFVELVRTELGLVRVHIIAHSMGSRLLSRAMERLDSTPEHIKHAEVVELVFAAPDVDPITFERLAAAFARNCKRCTLYSSSKDLALHASRLIYHFPRAGGAAGEDVRGVDTIDATNVDTSLIGHSYFGDSRTLLADLFELFEFGRGPESRFGLRQVKTEGGRYWEFRP